MLGPSIRMQKKMRIPPPPPGNTTVRVEVYLPFYPAAPSCEYYVQFAMSVQNKSKMAEG